MQRKTRIKVDELGHLLIYILGHRPDEFGLIPDEEGFLGYKDLLRAIHEEPGWGYVKQSDITEVLIVKGRAHFEWDENRIRALDRRWSMALEEASPDVPKLLYAGVRRRAHPVVMEKGLKSETFIPLAPDRDMAVRIGRRRDREPVILEIMTGPAREQGIAFYAFGELFLARDVPSRFISGPPVPQETRETKHPQKRKEAGPAAPPPDFHAGTFILDAGRDPDRRRRLKGRKERSWKEEARKMRRRKKG